MANINRKRRSTTRKMSMSRNTSETIRMKVADLMEIPGDASKIFRDGMTN